MKTLNILSIAFATLIFSGCYTQLLIEDDPPTSANAQPVASQPLPPVTNTEVLYGADPEPVYVPVPVPVYIPQGNSNPVTATPVAAPVQRTSGVQRSGSESSQTSSQNTTRNSGSTRR